MFCRNCTLAQLGEVVDPNVLYKNYLYTTSTSQTMQRHFDRLLKDLVSENGKGSILEVGSNDGALLDFAIKQGFTNVVGVDPAQNLNRKWDFQTICGLFDSSTARQANSILRDDTDFILARHCFCHMEWTPFMEACAAIAHKNTLAAIEVPYAPDLLRETQWDTVYSEHTSFLTIKSVVALIRNYPFHLHAVLRYGVHGGCVLLMLRHNDSGIQPHLSADEMLAQEDVSEAHWLMFARRTKEKIDLLQKMIAAKRSDRSITSAFGASAKGSVVINACGFDDKDIAFVTDNSALKPGRLIPGTQIPIIEEGEMLSHHPDYSLVSAWNYKSEILQKMDKYRKRGGKFIFPTHEGWEIV
jgi:C-methyltransferase C-terminal domain/Methyltransferase domain